MLAVVEDRGRQYRVEDGKRILVDRLDAEVGSEVSFPVLLLDRDGVVKIGAPRIDGASVTCKVVAHVRGPKGIAGFFRRRKDSRRRVGFRADRTAIQVVSISA
jgi:large subunit ribosomal protein L21